MRPHGQRDPVPWTIPGRASPQHSCRPCPLRQSRKSFQKERLFPLLRVPKRCFHGDSQIANPAKSEQEKEKLASPQRSGHGWRWGWPLLRMNAGQAGSPSGPRWGSLRDARSPASGSGPCGELGGASPPPLPLGGSWVTPSDTSSSERQVGQPSPWCTPVFHLKTQAWAEYRARR